MDIRIDLSRLHLPKGNEINIATSRALNHTLGKAVTAGNKAVTKEWNIKLKELKPYIHTTKATQNSHTAIIKVKSRSISLNHFEAKQLKRGVSFKLKKNKKRTTLKHTFIAKTKNGYIGVFKRKGLKRLPLNTFKSISPSSMYKTDGGKAVDEVVERDFNSRFIHELNRITKSKI